MSSPASDAHARTTIEIPNSQPMVALLGSNDEYLRLIERSFPDVDILVRGNQITVDGSAKDIGLIDSLVAEMLAMLRTGHALTAESVERSIGMLRTGTRPTDVLTANTAGVLESLAPLFAERQLALLPNPLPMPRLDAQPVGAGERQGLVCVARLVHQKGLDVLIEALVSGEGALMTWPLTLVGDGPERLALEQQVRDRRLAERVHFMGFRSDPQTFLQQAAVFVLPSRFEGMPNALLEAMAAGLAVVVTDASPGPLEVVDDGVTGLVVPSEAPQALAAALERLAVDPALRARLGAAAQTRLRQMDWSVVGPIWDQLVGGP